MVRSAHHIIINHSFSADCITKIILGLSFSTSRLPGCTVSAAICDFVGFCVNNNVQ